MSGTTTTPAFVSQIPPRGTAAGVVVIAYDPIADAFATVYPSALQGMQGPQGEQGPVGPQGPQGVPGSPGTNGNTVRYGDGPPPGTTGVNGDWYIDRQNWIIYGPKANGAWPGTGQSLVGPQGPQGPQGPAGEGGGGTGGTANLDDGTADGQIAVWSASLGRWVPQTGVSIVADRTPTVEINANTTLTFDAHNRRNLVLSGAATLTLAASEVGAGMEFVVNNDHTGTNTITFGSGITVQQPATGTGGAASVKVAANGVVPVQIYPKGTGLIAKVRGDVA